ncbi:MAG: hypothetical protein ACR2QJ_09090, partial [Geminicoccaceae bacterium]
EVDDLLLRHGLVTVETHHLGVVPVLKEQKPLRSSALVYGLERIAAGIPLLAPWSALKVHAVRAREAA